MSIFTGRLFTDHAQPIALRHPFATIVTVHGRVIEVRQRNSRNQIRVAKRSNAAESAHAPGSGPNAFQDFRARLVFLSL